MSQYPNRYYEELAGLIIKNASLALKSEEVCFYEERAKSYQIVTKIIEKPKTKTSFFWTPWVAGIKRKKEIQVSQKQETEYYKGTLYITNMRLVFKCKVDAFDLMITNISSVKQYRNGIRVLVGSNAYDVMTSDVERILHIIDIMNKAFKSDVEAEDAKQSEIKAQTTKSKATVPDTEIPWGWVTANRGFIEPRDSKLADLMQIAANTREIDKKINALKDLITYYHTYRQECEERGGDFYKYFLGMHVYVNGKKDFLINKWQTELKNLEDGYLDVKEKEDVIAKAKPTLKADIIAVIQSNQGILQKDLYSHFDPLLKEEIYATLYELLKEGKLTKEKCGNSNKLFIV